jgi:hypothetical protein
MVYHLQVQLHHQNLNHHQHQGLVQQVLPYQVQEPLEVLLPQGQRTSTYIFLLLLN